MPRGKPFSAGNAGKPKGAQNKTTRLVKEVFAAVFDELQSDKKANLKAWAKENPTEFYRLAAKLIPVQLTGEGGGPIKQTIDLSGLPDHILDALIEYTKGQAHGNTE